MFQTAQAFFQPDPAMAGGARDNYYDRMGSDGVLMSSPSAAAEKSSSITIILLVVLTVSLGVGLITTLVYFLTKPKATTTVGDDGSSASSSSSSASSTSSMSSSDVSGGVPLKASPYMKKPVLPRKAPIMPRVRRNAVSRAPVSRIAGQSKAPTQAPAKAAVKTQAPQKASAMQPPKGLSTLDKALGTSKRLKASGAKSTKKGLRAFKLMEKETQSFEDMFPAAMRANMVMSKGPGPKAHGLSQNKKQVPKALQSRVMQRQAEKDEAEKSSRDEEKMSAENFLNLYRRAGNDDDDDVSASMFHHIRRQGHSDLSVEREHLEDIEAMLDAKTVQIDQTMIENAPYGMRTLLQERSEAFKARKAAIQAARDRILKSIPMNNAAAATAIMGKAVEANAFLREQNEVAPQLRAEQEEAVLHWLKGNNDAARDAAHRMRQDFLIVFH